MEYTHNLKIVLLENNRVIEDKVVLDEIKNILSNKNTHKIEWNGRVLDITIEWDKYILSDMNQILMGDLFSCPIYEHDSIILNHTQKTIVSIKCKYMVAFYVSRIIYHKTLDKRFIGVV